MAFDELLRNFNIRTHFLQYYSLLSAIPNEWKKQLCLNDVSKNLRHVSNTSFSTRSISCKKAYKILVRKHTDPPTSQGRLIKYGINESELSLYYLLLTHETKLSLFQFKILHNILPTNLHFYRINMRDSSSCPIP